MRGDFSAWNKDRSQNFRGTLHQQGRVLLDRDWNAQTEIFGEWQETAARDAFGAGVAAIPADSVGSFKVTAADKSSGTVKISLNKGRAWADGLLVELAENKTLTAKYLGLPIQSTPAPDDIPANGTKDAVILETWLEELSAFQAPKLLLEDALGGIDTTERVKTAFRLRLYRMAAGETCDSIIPKLRDDFDAKGKLAVELNPTTLIDGDCPVIEGGGFTGFEHRLYRIEIADTDAALKPGAHFKWSQQNGGLVGRGDYDAASKTIDITGNRNAILLAGTTNFYLEVIQFDEDLNVWTVRCGATAVLSNGKLDLNAADVFKGGLPSAGSCFFRLWNGIEKVADFVAAKKLLPDNQGIFLHFEAEAAGKYTPSDFWTFEARAGSVGNPRVLIGDPVKVIAGDPVSSSGRAPQGIFYHRVPLAEIHWTNNTPPATEIEDCRRPFQPLTKLKTCCTYRVGDGVHSHGDFTKIQDAIDALPKKGGEVCILPGIYVENVVIKPPHNRRIILKGCGRRTVIRAKEFKEYRDNPELCAAIYVLAGQNVSIESLAVEAHAEGYGIYLEGAGLDAEGKNAEKYLTDINLSGLFVATVQKTAIKAHTAQNLTLSRSAVFILEDKFSRFPAVYLSGDDMLVEHTEIRVLPKFARFIDKTPTIPEIGADPDEFATIGELLELVALKTGSKNQFVTNDPGNFVAADEAPGGLQIAGGSERVRIIDNLIVGGRGNGISLGNVDLFKDGEVVTNHDPFDPKDTDEDCCKPGDDHTDGEDENEEGYKPIAGPPLFDILIKFNRIFNMGRNGIGLAMTFNLDEEIDLEKAEIPEDPGAMGLIFVSKLVISENRIERCLALSADDIVGAQIITRGYGGISLAIVEELVITDNFIVDNCRDVRDAVCGIFVLATFGCEISRNEITEHLPQDYEKLTAKEMRTGARGGIWILIAVGQMDIFNYFLAKRSALSLLFDRFSDDHALKIDGNVVATPMGRSLTTMIVGDASIIGNRFASFGLPPVELVDLFRLVLSGNANYAVVILQLLNLVSTNVLILDLGTLVLFKGFNGLVKGANTTGKTDTNSNLEEEAGKAEAEAQAAEANFLKARSEFDAARKKAEETGSSADKLAFEAAKAKAEEAKKAAREARDRADEARKKFEESGSTVNAAAASAYDAPMAMKAPNVKIGVSIGTATSGLDRFFEVMTKGGLIDFSHNQCKFNPRGRQAAAALCSVFIAGIADQGFKGNQISCDMPRMLMFTNALLLGSTIRVNGNLFRENYNSVMFSAFSWGILNNTSDNESVHCLLVRGTTFLNRFNLVLRTIPFNVQGNIATDTYPENDGVPIIDLQEQLCSRSGRNDGFYGRMLQILLGKTDVSGMAGMKEYGFKVG